MLTKAWHELGIPVVLKPARACIPLFGAALVAMSSVKIDSTFAIAKRQCRFCNRPEPSPSKAPFLVGLRSDDGFTI